MLRFDLFLSLDILCMTDLLQRSFSTVAKTCLRGIEASAQP